MNDPRTYRARAAIAVEALQTFYDADSGLWRTTGWWNSANALGALIDYAARTGDASQVPIIANTFEKNAHGGFINDFYDDEGWWALAWIKAYDLTDEQRYLDAARVLFDDMRSSWDDVCGGGVWSNKVKRYKNAIANELFLVVAARLHAKTRHDEHLEWARREWSWFARSGLINTQHLVNDGLTPDCRNNGGVTWTYNQGVILGGLVALHESTGDESLLSMARAIADAAIMHLANDDRVLVEPYEPDLGNDGPQFKGIFARNLAVLYETTREPRYRDFLVANADSIWERSRNPSNFFGVRWTGPFDTSDAARQSSALDALNATLTVT